MEKMIRPRRTYFESYSFRYQTSPETILERFAGERRQFVSAVLNHCHTRKIWTSVDIDAILKSYPADRPRIIAALEFFDEKGWIALQAGQTVEVYDIVARAIDIDALTEKMYALFKKKEAREIRRIHRMVEFFEYDGCISSALAAYFGEQLQVERCGHCSYCQSGKAVLPRPAELAPLADFDFEKITAGFVDTIGEPFSEENLTRFLCGVYTPLFSKLKARTLPNFGILENYAFPEVQKWVHSQVKGVAAKV